MALDCLDRPSPARRRGPRGAWRSSLCQGDMRLPLDVLPEAAALVEVETERRPRHPKSRACDGADLKDVLNGARGCNSLSKSVLGLGRSRRFSRTAPTRRRRAELSRSANDVLPASFRRWWCPPSCCCCWSPRARVLKMARPPRS